jgi:imidazolonepropionase-like amidohydrolase
MTRLHRALALAVLLASTQCGPPVAPSGPQRSPGPGAGTPQPASDAVIAFVGATVVPLDSAALLADQTVVIRGDRIERIGVRTAIALPAGTRIIDGRGRYLIPGLMDMHVHLAATRDLALLLALGVTTVRNMWGAPIHLAWRDRIARGELLGPTIVTAGPILDGDPPAHPGSWIVRSAADADRAIALHRRLGYDFIKIYNRLSPEVFDHLMAAAARARLPVAGHVPWDVPIEHAIDAGMISIEHMTGLIAALQAADSPLAGRTDRASRALQIDHVDEARIGPLVQRIAAHHTFEVPTRAVMDQFASAAEVRARLALPEMQWLAPRERVIAEPRPDEPDEIDRDRRRLALFDRVLRALDQAGAPIATGTDPFNPLVIHGFSLHRELELLVGAGLSPLAALQAATRRGAELIGRPGELGRIAPGMRADLVLLDANPLDDIHHTRRIAGVMARGRYHDRRELDALLARLAAELAGPDDALRDGPALRVAGEPVFRGAYDITWRDVAFGEERIAVGRRGEDLDAALESFDPHSGEITRAHWQSHPAPGGAALTLDLDGATGRGHLEVRRDDGQLHARGTSLPGAEVSVDRPIAADALLTPDGILSAVVLWRPQLQALAVGQAIELRERTIGLASEIDDGERTVRVRRLADRPGTGAMPASRVYELAPPRGRAAELTVDADGWPLELARADHGALLRLRRRPPG